MLTGSKLVVNVMLTDVVKPILSYIHVLETSKEFIKCTGYVSYQYHVDTQMFANIFCSLDGSMSPSLSGVLWMNGGLYMSFHPWR